MKFKEVLDHLVRFHRIDEDGLPTFKARIQILRNVGIPAIDKVGKGSWASFTANHLAELHLALTMSEFGFTPVRISQFMDLIRITPPWWPLTRNVDSWLVICLRASNGKLSDMDSRDVIQCLIIVNNSGLKPYLDELLNYPVPRWTATISLNRIIENLKSAE